MPQKHNILLIPVASRMVSKKLIDDLKNNVQEKIEEENKNANIESIDEVMNEENWEDLTSEINRILDNFDGFIITHLSGGTSRIVLEFLSDLNNIKPFALLALSKFNSLPSALNTRERIIQFLAKKIYIPILYEKYNLRDLFRYFYVINNVLKRYNVLFLAPTVGVKVQPNFKLVRPARLSKFTREISDKELSEVLDELKTQIKIEYKGEKREKIALSLYKNLKIAMERFANKYMYGGVKGLACLDCYYIMRRIGVAPCLAVSALLKDGFLVACQRDLSSLFAMLLLKLLTGQPSWIADVSGLNEKENSLILSHSCFNLSMASSAEAILHPITHLPYSIKAIVDLNKKVTLFTIDPVNENFDVEVGEIISLNKYENTFESTQIEVKLLSTSIEEFIKRSHRGHYIITWGDWRRDLERINKLIIQVRTIQMLKGKLTY